MSRIYKIAFVSVLVLATLACGAISNPLSGAQNLASTAEALATAMPVSTLKALPSAMPDVSGMLNPTGKPVTDWNGIPIMKQATAGQEFNKSSYSFKVNATATDVQTFYDAQLKALGWSSAFNATGGSEGGVMLFTKSPNILSITVSPDSSGGVVVILYLQ